MTPEERAKEEREMEQRYRNVFGTDEGRRVLGDILVSCHFGMPIKDETERVEYNLGIAILRQSGTISSIYRLLGIRED